MGLSTACCTSAPLPGPRRTPPLATARRRLSFVLGGRFARWRAGRGGEEKNPALTEPNYTAIDTSATDAGRDQTQEGPAAPLQRRAPRRPPDHADEKDADLPRRAFHALPHVPVRLLGPEPRGRVRAGPQHAATRRSALGVPGSRDCLRSLGPRGRLTSTYAYID